MAKLPDITDPTLQAIDLEIEGRQSRKPRPYLGMSGIGHNCLRNLWYGFRWASIPLHNAATLKRFEDGHRGEDMQASRLRMVTGIELHTVDADSGEQFGFCDIGGHFRGHMDGAVNGLLQAPTRWHVWEHKQSAEKTYKALIGAKAKVGEKLALAKWNTTYHAQAQLYMHYSGMQRHYLTCSTPGGRMTTSVRTDADSKVALGIVEKARQVIVATSPLERMSADPEYFECKWCDHHNICHRNHVPEATCRTCCHATPEMDADGRWSCAYHRKDLSTEDQRHGCDDHVFIPALLDTIAKVDTAKPDGNWIAYRFLDNDGGFKNGTDQIKSADLQSFLLDEIMERIKWED